MVIGAMGRQTVDYLHCDRWIVVICGADLDGCSTGDYEFERVVGRRNSTNADQWEIDGLRHFVDHSNGDWPDRWTRQSSRAVAQSWASSINVDAHSDDSVDEGKAIGSGVCNGSSKLRNVRNIRRELYYERPVRRLLRSRGEARGGRR